MVETALADLEQFRTDAAAYRRSGHRIEVAVLATTPAESQLGVLDSYPAGGLRYVSWENQAHCTQQIPTVLEAMETEQLVDRVVLLRRGCELLYDNELDCGGGWRRRPTAARAWARETGRPWSARETTVFRRERATTQAQLAFVTAFTSPQAADAELALAEQYLTGLNLRATRITLQTTALVRDAGTSNSDLGERARLLRADIAAAGLNSAQATLELVVCFHHAVRGAADCAAASIARLNDLTRGGDYAYYVDIAHFMAGLPHQPHSTVRWLHGPDAAWNNWRRIIITRQEFLERGGRL
ncbi:zeta toxin family protein [Streptomyces xanthochromogenes]|uniref:zeta toxin family protein n=1 Tax=Streptomyces xanthochromogenes TaxID=67384 RepID=UPI0038058E5D